MGGDKASSEEPTQEVEIGFMFEESGKGGLSLVASGVSFPF
jgi:hypothetical protein